MEIKPIARIENEFPEKFGIPRQSGLVKTKSAIVFEAPYRNPDALRGLDGYSHIWLIWHFSACEDRDWTPTVRPPRLGGNTRVGVFSTRSPFRPNSLGLSCVKLLGIEHTEDKGNVLIVEGADLMDGTPIYDIKPYLAYTDSHPDAVCGFADSRLGYALEVTVDCNADIPPEKLDLIIEILRNDPRPAYQDNPNRVYKMTAEGYNVEFTVCQGTLHVIKIES